MISCLLLTHWSLTYQLFNLSLTNDLQLISCLLLIICYFWSLVFIRWCWPPMFILSIVFTNNYTRVPEPWFGLPCTCCFYPQLYKSSFPYSLQTQVLIVVAESTLHDYIRQEAQKDWFFEKYSNTDMIIINSNDEKGMKSYAGWSCHTSSVRWPIQRQSRYFSAEGTRVILSPWRFYVLFDNGKTEESKSYCGCDLLCPFLSLIRPWFK